MLFTEPTFLFLFLPVLLALYFATGARVHGAYGNWLLLLASVIFYAKGGGAFTWLMLASIAFNYWMAIAVDRARGRSEAAATRRVALAVATNLVVLGIFKYANFFADNVNTLFLVLRAQPIVVPRVLLPIGISFFTFHAISYVVDVYRRDATAQKSPVHAALYLLLFPQLIAGPIIRYRDIADQLARRIVTVDDFAYGVRRFVIGLGKKVLVANVVAGPADRIFALRTAELSTAHAWLGIVCYTFQIYFDFSGYSDMAIGLGRMFGFRFPENFRWPYVATSIQGFWRRWHLSLSTWFRDYLYIPLGGNRVSPSRQYRNLVTVFFLCGLWHGASWNFVIWGLWHGAFLVIERLWGRGRARHAPSAIRHDRNLQAMRDDGNPHPAIRNDRNPHPAIRNDRNPHPAIRNDRNPHPAIRNDRNPHPAIRNDNGRAHGAAVVSWPIWPHLYTMIVVMIGWVFFRAETLPGAVAFLKAMAGLSGAAPTPYTVSFYLTPELWVALVAGAIGSTPWVPALAARTQRSVATELLATATLMALLVASIMQMAARSYNPFIYFRF